MAEQDEAHSEGAHQLMHIDHFWEGRKLVNKEIQSLIWKGFEL